MDRTFHTMITRAIYITALALNSCVYQKKLLKYKGLDNLGKCHCEHIIVDKNITGLWNKVTLLKKDTNVYPRAAIKIAVLDCLAPQNILDIHTKIEHRSISNKHNPTMTLKVLKVKVWCQNIERYSCFVAKDAYNP